MKIAIDTSPFFSGHSIRGVGFYLKNLLDALKRYHPENEYLEFVKGIPKNADLVHYPYFDPFFLTLPLYTRMPIAVTVHDLTPLVLPKLFPVGIKGKIKWELQKLRLRHASRIITDSLSSRNDIQRLTGIPLSKIDSIYLAAGQQFQVIKDSLILEKVKKKYQLPEAYVLYVGDGTPNKNVVRIAKACLEAKISLVIAGKAFDDNTINVSHPWAKDIGEIHSLASKNGKMIKLLGFVPDEDLATLYTLATVFLMPSLYEGFGLPIVEAFSCGTPVICSDKGSLKEVAGDAAMIIDPENIDNIKTAIQNIISDKKLSKQLSEKGLKRAHEFSWEKTANETIAAYKKSISTNS